MTVVTNNDWWDRVPADIHHQNDHTELDQRYWFKVHAAAAMDRVVRTGLSSMVSGALAPSVMRYGASQAEQQSLQIYRGLADSGDRDLVFQRPDKPVLVRESKPAWHRYKPSGINCLNLEFESPYQPQAAPIAEAYQSHRSNRTAHAQFWYHPEQDRPTLIFVHGYLFSAHRVYNRMFDLPWFYRSGYNVLLYRMPFHGDRRGHLDPWSGYGMFARGLSSFNEAMLQAVQELRLFMDEMENRGITRMGISGISMGGYLSAVMAVADPRLKFCIPNSPLVSPLDTALSWVPTRWLYPILAKRYGMEINELRHAMALHSPLSWPLQMPNKKVLIIGGAGDRITPPRYVRMLHDHWRGSHLHWFPGNHLVHLQQSYYLRLMKWFMDRHTGQS